MFSEKNRALTISYLAMGVILLALFWMKLMPTMIAGLVVFLIINQIHKKMGERFKSTNAHNLTLILISVIVFSLLTCIGLGIYSFLQVGSGNMEQMSGEAMNVINQLKTYLPESWLKFIPEDFLTLKQKAVEFGKSHVSDMLKMTGASLHGVVSVILGMFIGAVIAFSFLHNEKNGKRHSLNVTGYPYLEEFMARVTVFASMFAKVGGAQVKISAINAVLTAVYLLVLVPLFGYNIPYATTLVVCTFLFGIIPVLGNLITNTLIVVLSLLVSLELAIASLVFLVVVHKLEYYVNAKIVGSQIKTSIWELLIAMIVFQTLFGVIGVVLAPVIYGYIKEELKQKNIIPF